MVMRKKPLLAGNGINWVLVISAASAIIYLSSYLFQWGYNGYYRIPTVLISLDWAKISFSLIPILAILLINIVGVEIIYSLFGYDSRKPKERKRAYINLGYLNLAVLISALISVQQSSVLIVGNVTIWILFIVVSFIIRFGPDKLVFFNPLAALDKKLDNTPRPKYRSILGDYVPHPSEVVIGVLYSVIFAMLIFVCGTFYASIKKEYLVSSKDNTIVLNTFGDKAVVDKLNKNNVLQGSIAVIDITQAKDFQVKKLTNLVTKEGFENRQETRARTQKIGEFITNFLKSSHL